MTNCCCKKPTAEQAKIIEEMLAAPYPVTVSSIAGRLGVTDLEAAELLPEAKRFPNLSQEVISRVFTKIRLKNYGSVPGKKDSTG